MYDDRVDIPSIPTTLSIEHVMPQSWSKNWPLDTTAGEGSRCDGDRAKRPDHRIGNLTLTAIKMDMTLSNESWQSKQPELNRGSKLLMNADLTARYGVAFDEAAIDQRTTELAQRVCAIWPRD